MATFAAGVLTLMDWAKRVDSTGKIPLIVEMLGQNNGILQDMRFIEGNQPMGHMTIVRTGLPTVAWRKLNQGVTPSKSTTAQITEACGILEAWSEVDKDIAEMNGDLGAFRMSEARPFIEAMRNEMASKTFYGATSSPEQILGLAARYSSTTAANGSNVLSAGGSQSDNSSIWLIVWGDQTVHGIFPKGSKAGLDHLDRGLETVEVTAGVAGDRMLAYRERYQWKTGIALKDWRFAVRICNIDISTLVANSSPADLTMLMTKAVHRIPDLSRGTPVFYANRTCIEFLDIQRQLAVKTGGGLNYLNVDGQNNLTFRGIPIRLEDALLETESTVS